MDGIIPMLDFQMTSKRARSSLVVLWVTAGLLLFLAILVTVLWQIYVTQGKRAVAEKLSDLRGAGYIVTLEEVNARYHDPSLNQEENGAPLYQEAFLRLENRRAEGEAIERIRRALLTLNPEDRPHEESITELAELLERNAEGLTFLKEASSHPYVRFDLDFTEGYELLIPHVGQTRQGARLLSLDAMWQALNGEADKAAESLDAGLAIAAHMVAEPTILSQLVRLAIVEIFVETTEWLLERRLLSPAGMEAIESRLRWHDANVGLEIGLEAEMAAGNSLFAGSPLDVFEQDDFRKDKWNAVLHVHSGKIHRDRVFFLQAMEDQVKLLRDPVETWLSHPDRDWAAEADKKGHMLSAIFVLSGSRGIRQREVHSIANLRIVRILLAMERHRAKAGVLPENVEALVPDLLVTVPVDPVNGRPFTVVEEGARLVFQSAGMRRDGPREPDQLIQGSIGR